MKELLELIAKAEREGKIQVVKIEKLGEESNQEEPQQEVVQDEVANDFDELAKLHKELFDAHVRAGFNEKQALQLTKVVIKNLNE